LALAASMHDAEKTVSLDAGNVKGWSRLAKAHLQLLQPDETRDALSHGLALSANNKDMLRIQVSRLRAPRQNMPRCHRQQHVQRATEI
jgi:cytochrome c-type biogenesis protein CcmH/NrfG